MISATIPENTAPIVPKIRMPYVIAATVQQIEEIWQIARYSSAV